MRTFIGLSPARRDAPFVALAFGDVTVARQMDARALAYETPRREIAARVPVRARRVLDLGCASGGLATLLKARGDVEVVGVEVDEAYAAAAAGRCDRVVRADAEALARRDDLEAELGRFDCLVAADVLEHLVDPWSALRAFTSLLEPHGTAVVSLPNVAHWSTYAHLARGTWPRLPEGVHDATHLRWFTLRDARELLEQAGLAVAAMERRPRLIWRGSRLDDLLGPAVVRVPVLRTLATFQHVFAAYPARRCP
jgi:methionine biosynthesis protein MetW